MSIRNKEREHNARTRSIWMKPELIGLDNIIMSTNEVNMFKKNSTDLYHQPDNIFFDYDKFRIYNVEYKLHNNKTKAVKQLRETASYLRKMFRNYDVHNLYIHDNYKIEEIK